MPEDIYEVVALAARYWFTFLGALIVWRAFRWLRQDRRAKHRRLKQLPDAGMVGELVVLAGDDALPPGTALPLPREGVLGKIRTCDVTVPVAGVAAKHLDFTFRDGRGLLIFPRGRCTALVDGIELERRSASQDYPMHHGSRLAVGEAVLRLRLFAGLETGGPPAPPAPPAPSDVPGEGQVYHQMPAPWAEPYPWAQGPEDAYPPAADGPLPPGDLPPIEACPPAGYEPPAAYPAEGGPSAPPWAAPGAEGDAGAEPFPHAAARDRRPLLARIRRRHGKS